MRSDFLRQVQPEGDGATAVRHRERGTNNLGIYVIKIVPYFTELLLHISPYSS